MVLTATQATVFFENSAQMSIPHETRIQLQSEGIDGPEHIVDFNEDSMSKISNELRWLGGRFLDMTPGAVVGDAIPTPLFNFGETFQLHFIVVFHLVIFYEVVGRYINSTNVC